MLLLRFDPQLGFSKLKLLRLTGMSDRRKQERKVYWDAIESGSDPLLCSMNSMVERWGMPAMILALGNVARILAEDAEDAKLTPQQRSLIIGSCARMADTADNMAAEMRAVQAMSQD